METLDLHVDAVWAVGLLLSTVRVGAFVVVSPILGRSVPFPGRLAFALGIGAFLTQPVQILDLPHLLSVAVVNAAVGGALGWLTGVLFHLFAIAGGLVDVSSNLSAAAVFDPNQGGQSGVFGRLFNFTALTLVMVTGGLTLLVAGLASSRAAVPLDGTLTFAPGLGAAAVELVSRVMIAGVEVALPVMAALFLVEVLLGVAARFAPQANIFLVGIPAKLLAALAVTLASVLLFPEAADGYLATVRSIFTDVLGAIGT